MAGLESASRVAAHVAERSRPRRGVIPAGSVLGWRGGAGLGGASGAGRAVGDTPEGW
jgi:hypothetical protein